MQASESLKFQPSPKGGEKIDPVAAKKQTIVAPFKSALGNAKKSARGAVIKAIFKRNTAIIAA